MHEVFLAVIYRLLYISKCLKVQPYIYFHVIQMGHGVIILMLIFCTDVSIFILPLFECAGPPMFILMATLQLTLKLSSVEAEELNVVGVEIRVLLLVVMKRIVARAFTFLVQS